MHTLELEAAPVILAPRPVAPVPSHVDSLPPARHAADQSTNSFADSTAGETLDALVISDLHLGSDNCQAKPLADFLQQILAGAIRTRRRHDCQVAICGHTHHAAADTAGAVHYYNSGCWTENPAHYLTLDRGRVQLHAHYPATVPAPQAAAPAIGGGRA